MYYTFIFRSETSAKFQKEKLISNTTYWENISLFYVFMPVLFSLRYVERCVLF